MKGISWRRYNSVKISLAFFLLFLSIGVCQASGDTILSYNFNEGSGNIVKDLSCQGHNGIVNSATWNPTGGIAGSGAYFFDVPGVISLP